MVNSRQKGKVGEREAVKYLQKIGFADAKRSAQVSGKEAADIHCHSLDRIHFEVKFGYPTRDFGIGSAQWHYAIRQASRDSKVSGRSWVVMWRNKGCTRWMLTYLTSNPQEIVTISGDTEIKRTLLRIQDGIE